MDGIIYCSICGGPCNEGCYTCFEAWQAAPPPDLQAWVDQGVTAADFVHAREFLDGLGGDVEDAILDAVRYAVHMPK
jgi:hypothetical protein